MPAKNKQRRMIYLTDDADNKVEELTNKLNMSNSAFFEMLAHSFYDYFTEKDKPTRFQNYIPKKELTEKEEDAKIKNYPAFLQHWMQKGVI